jgi:AraC-like DNA-binding protein
MSFSVGVRAVMTNRLGPGEWLQLSIVKLGMANCRSLRRGWWQDTFWKIYLNLDEGTEIGTELGPQPLAADEIGVLPPWQSWKHDTLRPVRHIWIVADAPQLPASLVRKHFLGLQRLPRTRAWREQADEIAAIVGELDRDEPLSLALSCRVHAVAYRIFGYLMARLAHVTSPPEPVRSVLDHIDSHLAGDCRVPALARAAGVGEKTLNAAFRAAVGVTTAAYVRERRIARAADLLLTSEWSVDRIAELTGFPNRHYLSRVFAKRMGAAPAAYRERGRPAH